MSKRKKREQIITIVVLSITGACLLITGFLLFLFIKYLPNSIDTNNPIDPQAFGLFGDVVGGVVGTILAFLSIYLLYLTYRSQKKELRHTKYALEDQKNESTFFSLVSSLREIINSMDGEVKVMVGVEGRKVSKQFRGREYLYQLYEYFKAYYVYDELPEELMFNPETNKLHTYSEETTGEVNQHGNPAAKRVPNLEHGIEVEATKHEIEMAFNGIFDNHRHNLDHYFRFIKSLTDFIESIEYDPDRERYLKILKAQLSTYEMGLLFYHSLSNPLGEDLYSMDFLENLDYESFIDDWHHLLYPFTDFKFLTQQEIKQKQEYRKYLRKQRTKRRKAKNNDPL